jgi:YbbR domain-containing protein
LTLSHLNIVINNLDPKYQAAISPNSVDVILSGPLPLLDSLSAADVQAEIDLQDLGIGSHQITPKVKLSSSEIRVESVLPVTLEVTITPSKGATPTAKP